MPKQVRHDNMIRQLLIATTNKAKLEELKLGLKELEKEGTKLLTLNDVGVEKEPKESGKTFCENAQIKAKFYGEATGLPTLADDGGLIIPSLNNEPGVKSRRWLGYEASDVELITYTLERLKTFSQEKRVAYLQTCLCFYLPGGVTLRQAQGDKSIPQSQGDKSVPQAQGNKSVMVSLTNHDDNNKIFLFAQEKIRGYIAKRPSGKATDGYPFRALFIVEKYNKYYDELTEEEHNKINHRLKALKKLVKKIKIYL